MNASSLPHILLADDESSITANLAPFLERAGFHVDSVADGQSALAYIQARSPDLVVLDVLMPGLDGREVLRRLRRTGDLRPVILLTQVGAATERALALEEGADDYLNKPFDPIELLARIRAVLRRAQPGQPSLASAWRLTAAGSGVTAAGSGVSAAGSGAAGSGGVAELIFDRRARRVTLAGKALTLTPKALAVLEYLMTHPDELLTRERLLDAVWGWDYPTGTRTVDTRVAELRRVLGDDAARPRFIETMAGEGYRFVAVVRGDKG